MEESQNTGTVTKDDSFQILQKVAPAHDLAVHLAALLLQLLKKCCSPGFSRFPRYLVLVHSSLPVQSLFLQVLLCFLSSPLLPVPPDSLSLSCAFWLQHVSLS